MSLVKFSLEVSTTYKSICVKITLKQQELVSNKCDKPLCNLHSEKSYAHLNMGTELKTFCTGQYLDRKSCLTINKHALR